MADPKVSNKPQVTAYTGIEAGVIRNSAKENFAMAGLVLNGEVSWKGAFARTKFMAGTALGGEAELGYRFDLGRNMGLELSAKTQMYRNQVSELGSTTQTAESHHRAEYTINNQDGTNTINYAFDDNHTSSWKHGMQQTGLKAQLNFGSKKTQFGVGLEAGTRNSLRPTINYNSDADFSIDAQAGDKKVNIENLQKSVAINVNNGATGYVDGTVQFKQELGKNFTLQADANVPIIDKSKAFQAHVGIAYRIK